MDLFYSSFYANAKNNIMDIIIHCMHYLYINHYIYKHHISS